MQSASVLVPRTSVLALALAVAGSWPAHAAPGLEGQALADRYGDCWRLFNEKKWDEFAKCYGPGSVSVAPGLPAAKGAAAIVEQHAKPIAGAFPDISGELQIVLVNGKRLMSVALFGGTHKGTLKLPDAAVPATGKSFGQLVAHGVESGGGTVAAKEWFVQDAGTMMAQLGLSSAPARPVLKKVAGARPTVVVATGNATEKANLAAAKKGYVAFNEQDKTLAGLFADDIVEHDQSMPKDVIGKAATADSLARFWKMSSSGKIDVPVMWAAGDYVVAVGTFAGVNDGALPDMGVPKTGKKFKVDVVEISRWENGKVKELWPFLNGAQLSGQLGLLPPPAAAAAGATAKAGSPAAAPTAAKP